MHIKGNGGCRKGKEHSFLKRIIYVCMYIYIYAYYHTYMYIHTYICAQKICPFLLRWISFIFSNIIFIFYIKKRLTGSMLVVAGILGAW